MSSAKPLMSLEGVEVRYPAPGGGLGLGTSEIGALRSVHLSIDRGQSVGLVGESGCGKSTLGRAALLLERPSAGRVIFDGMDIMRLKPTALRRLRSRMQMVFQDPQSSLNPRMTVGQLVAEPYQIHHPGATRKELDERVELLLAQVGLDPNVADRYPHEFSGGQRQRIAIARALSCDPEFIVADEPTSALDVSVQAQTLNLMINLQEERDLTFLFISHNLRVIQLFCHTIAVMYLGEIVETGPTSDVTAQPAHPYTDALMNAVPSVHKRMKPTPLEGDVPSPVDLPSGCAFHPRCPEPDKPKACYDTPPPLAEVTPTRKASCHLAADRLTRAGR